MPEQNLALRHIVDGPRLLMWACFVLVIASGWAYVLAVSPHFAGDSLAADLARSLCLADDNPWSGRSLGAAYVMWSAMIFAMMLPSAAPMVSTYMDIAGAARDKDMPVVSPLVLAAGYLSVWLVFSLAAVALQATLQAYALLDGDEALVRPELAAGVLIAAGVYQFLPVKHACLTKCARPMPFFLGNWRDTVLGVFAIGVRQGAYCVGCCWALMMVMFVTGLMNVIWMAIIGIVMILEKTVSEPRPWSYGSGALLVTAGVATLMHLLW